jgi:hypothetical protein
VSSELVKKSPVVRSHPKAITYGAAEARRYLKVRKEGNILGAQAARISAVKWAAARLLQGGRKADARGGASRGPDTSASYCETLAKIHH